MTSESSNTRSPIVDHELDQSNIDALDALPFRSTSLELSDTESSLDITPAEPERPPSKYIFEGHKKAISSFVFLHDNKHIVSGSEDGTMRKWDCETGLLVGEPWEGEGGDVYALALSPNGNIIACGRQDGSVQQWNTEGKMSGGVWMGHSDSVLSVSWSPNGGHIASGSSDRTILIRKAENGKVEVGPIETGQSRVRSVAYSPSGDRIASGGDWDMIYIWDSNTGDLLVGPIEGLTISVTSIVWSSDSSKLYFASGVGRVFDSVSGTELHRFQNDNTNLVDSVALSPKHNLLACVGKRGTAQLWDTESYQTLGKLFRREDGARLQCVSFSRDGRYLAYGGYDEEITMFMVKDIAPELPEIHPQSSSSSFEVDATDPFARRGGDDIEDGHDNPYDDFFQSLGPSHPLEAHGSSRPSQLRNLLSPRRLWNVFIHSRHRPLADQPIPLQPRINHGFFSRHTGPQPVTVSAARPRRFYWVAPRLRRPDAPENESVEEANHDSNAHAGQSSSAVDQLPHAAAPCSTPQGLQNLQAQSATRPPHEDEPDYGCWGNFLHAVCCIPHAHAIVPAVQPAPS